MTKWDFFQQCRVSQYEKISVINHRNEMKEKEKPSQSDLDKAFGKV
jgi:hypothetical protein